MGPCAREDVGKTHPDSAPEGSPSLCLRPSTGLFWHLLLGQQMGIVPSGSSKSDREAMALSSRRETSVW